ncbi:MAG TPA: YfiR family protein [Albitalea sp.]
MRWHTTAVAARAVRAGLALTLALGLASVAAAQSLEYAVKAAYLSKFGFYVEWPKSAFSGPSSPINLCVIGDDPFSGLLDDAVAGQQVEGRPIVVRRLKAAARDAGCHIAYLGGDARAPATIDSLRGTPTLVVTDAHSAGNASGVIQFVLKDNRVRFTIDDETAAQNGLAISSKLLSLALNVKPRGSR